MRVSNLTLLLLGQVTLSRGLMSIVPDLATTVDGLLQAYSTESAVVAHTVSHQYAHYHVFNNTGIGLSVSWDGSSSKFIPVPPGTRLVRSLLLWWVCSVSLCIHQVSSLLLVYRRWRSPSTVHVTMGAPTCTRSTMQRTLHSSYT